MIFTVAGCSPFVALSCQKVEYEMYAFPFDLSLANSPTFLVRLNSVKLTVGIGSNLFFRVPQPDPIVRT